MAILIFFVLHWYLSLFVQTFFLHRYAAHQMFTMSKTTERFFFLLTFVSQGSSYLSARAYGIMHRVHHAHTDTEDDPHSPSHDGNIFKMMWKTYLIYEDIYMNKADIDDKFKKNVPDWPALDRLACNTTMRTAWIGIYILFYAVFATHWWMFLLIPVHMFMGPIHGVIINWFAHKYGYRNFKVDNTSTNLMIWDIFMMGEGLHNNHHKYASRPNFGVKKFEFDPTYPIIVLLEKMNIIAYR